jgi:hypothetical protein
MPQQNLIHLSNTIISVGQFEVTNINSPSFLSKSTNPFHILPESGKPSPTKQILRLINPLTLFNTRNPMIKLTINAISTAPPSKKQTKIRSLLLILQIGNRITNIHLRITPRQRRLLLLLILSTNKLTIPKVILLIPLFIRVIIGQG